ncbi:hypothetical protein F2Q70_00007538 [Brassica cretica]|uniref:Uncharacterized protein n=1 Tax=Brassica cretica TaxID=69181 RepID=A0A8S9J4X2_BRACR|nr:hypothetical protein F2Q68_00000585 [Brassica cretica]KAF2613938.1 hypothetical protein F2Q70_00007538 [Brassica cretica]
MARNLLCCEKTQSSPQVITKRALEEVDIWFQINAQDADETKNRGTEYDRDGWASPSPRLTKCNVVSSWSEPLQVTTKWIEQWQMNFTGEGGKQL